MLFNSFSFLIFFPIIFTLYWSINKRNIKLQNILLLVASYYFYSCWDWRFLFLLIFSTALDYFTGIKINESNNERNRKFWFWLSIGVNLGFLGVFKYYNFFASSFAESLSYLGIHISPFTLNIILPVGISFYTFHGLSYVIDIYKRRINPERNFVDYSLFVSFFPLLVAGPIERATHLLPQFKKSRNFNYSQGVSGLQQILWGLFKKIVIADSCAEYSNLIFNNFNDYQGVTYLLGSFFFAMQVYGDFSGYSDIALGSARLLGIDLIHNFSFPYFSRSVSEFWRRWHISLSTWFRDYVYIPLGGNKGSKWLKIRNVLIVFALSGFWHGSDWNYIFWGILNALYIIPSIFYKNNKIDLEIVAKGKIIPSAKDFLLMSSTFFLILISFFVFRSENMSQSIYMIRETLIGLIDKKGYVDSYNLIYWEIGYKLPILLVFFLLFEWSFRERQFALENFGSSISQVFRWSFYIGLIFMILAYSGSKVEFIYFQF
jgi:alginate O-acetyltransferase complex protein AlgI